MYSKLSEVIKKVNKEKGNIKTGFVQFSNELNNILIELKINPLVYIALKRHENSQSKKCYPSYNTIARETGLSKVTVIKHIGLLEKFHLIEITREQRKNYYVIADLAKLKEKIDKVEQIVKSSNNNDFLKQEYEFCGKKFIVENWSEVLTRDEMKEFYFSLSEEEQNQFNELITDKR